ncbi:MAG: hypothetical protein R3B09_18325 [Nannocystaceae bacterium]
MSTLRRLARPALVLLSLAEIACAGDSSGSVTEGSSSGATSSTGTASMSSTSGSSATDTGTGTASSTTGTATDSGETTGALPPTCTMSSECPGGGRCLKKPCDVVMDEPGCGEFRCYADCSDPFSEKALWICADMGACCGGYPCMGGMCTEEFTSG